MIKFIVGILIGGTVAKYYKVIYEFVKEMYATIKSTKN